MLENTNSYRDVFNTLKTRYGKPVNVQVVCAALEAMGIRDVDVPKDYGFANIEAMAAHTFKELRAISPHILQNDNQKLAERRANRTFYISDYSAIKYKLFWKDFGNGLFDLLPILFQLIAIILLGFSLWTYVGFNDLQATAVVLGLILGLTATGGTIQAMGKQVAFYWYQEDLAMCERMVRKGIKAGMLLVIGLTTLFMTINLIANLYPFIFSIIVFLYAVSIGSLLLVFAPLYTIKKRWVLSASVLMGTLVAISLLLFSTFSIYLIHALGIWTSLLLAAGYLYYYFSRKKYGTEGAKYGTARRGVGTVRNSNYFIYGTLFYVFLFTDRIIAWSAAYAREVPFIIYYDKDYEIGMDLALLVFFLMAGILEYSVASFSRHMERKQRVLHHNQLKQFQAEMFRTYKKHFTLLLLNAAAATALLYYLVTKPWGYQAGFQDTLEPLSLYVAGVGCVGYIFLTIGIMNVLLLHTLNQSGKTIQFLLIAWATNCAIGLIASRMIGFEYSVLGLLAGSMVFIILSTKYIRTYFKNLEYHYYATL